VKKARSCQYLVPISRWRVEHGRRIRSNEHHPQRTDPLAAKDGCRLEMRFIERTFGIAV